MASSATRSRPLCADQEAKDDRLQTRRTDTDTQPPDSFRFFCPISIFSRPAVATLRMRGFSFNQLPPGKIALRETHFSSGRHVARQLRHVPLCDERCNPRPFAAKFFDDPIFQRVKVMTARPTPRFPKFHALPTRALQRTDIVVTASAAD